MIMQKIVSNIIVHISQMWDADSRDKHTLRKRNYVT
jgi:hypothetical protein